MERDSKRVFNRIVGAAATVKLADESPHATAYMATVPLAASPQKKSAVAPRGSQPDLRASGEYQATLPVGVMAPANDDGGVGLEGPPTPPISPPKVRQRGDECFL